MRIMARIIMSCVTVVGLASCGGGGGGGSSCSPTQTASLTINATGLSPTNVCVLPGGSVTFHNSDPAAVHDIEFETGGCPTVGDIPAGGQVSATFPTQENCTFHDGRNPSSSAFRGTVAVTTAAVGGGGY